MNKSGESAFIHLLYWVIRTRGQWPYRPAATKAMRNYNMNLNDFNVLNIPLEKKVFPAKGRDQTMDLMS